MCADALALLAQPIDCFGVVRSKFRVSGVHGRAERVENASPAAARYCSWSALADFIGGARKHQPAPPTPTTASPLRTDTPKATSPVTVLDPCASHVALRAPSQSHFARTLRAEAAHRLRTAYCELVRSSDARWTGSDIDEAQTFREHGAGSVVVRSPEQDALGVVACSVAVMRYVITDTFLQKHGLDVITRYHLAAILFAVYKLKTEDGWDDDSCMTMLVLERFLKPQELEGDWRTDASLRKEHERIVWASEAQLVTEHPFASLVDYGVHACFEVAMTQLLRCGALDEQQVVIGVGIASFFMHAAVSNACRELLEELARDRSTEEIGAVFAFVTLVAIRLQALRLQACKVGTALDLTEVEGTWPYDASMLKDAAIAVVLNAEIVAQCRPRDGAYACSEACVYPYVTSWTLDMLKTVLSDHHVFE